MPISPQFLFTVCVLFLSRVFMECMDYQPIIMLAGILPFHSIKHWVFYSPDIHDGTRRDLAMSLYHMNQSIVFSSKKCSLPKYSIAHFLENKVDDITELVYPSVLIAGESTCGNTTCGVFEEKSAINAFYTMSQMPLSSSIEAIICLFGPSECLNYIATNKTIIFMPAHRFLLGLCRDDQIQTSMYWLFKSKLPQIHVIPLGEYDREYINYFSGQEVPFIYPSSFYEYQPPRIRRNLFKEILVAPFKNIADGYCETLNNYSRANHYSLVFTTIRHKIRGAFSFNDLNRFPAVVVFPYAVLSYYLSDIIASAIPMIVPSRTYISEHYELLTDYRIQDNHYCRGRASLPERHANSIHTLSPEENTQESRYYWSQYASFYTPCSITFDSIEEIPNIVLNMNATAVYECGLRFIDTMKEHNEREWLRIIRSIKHRDMSKSYDAFLQPLHRNSTYL